MYRSRRPTWDGVETSRGPVFKRTASHVCLGLGPRFASGRLLIVLIAFSWAADFQREGPPSVASAFCCAFEESATTLALLVLLVVRLSLLLFLSLVMQWVRAVSTRVPAFEIEDPTSEIVHD